MADFNQEIAPLLEAEGGLNTNKSDRGGLTKYGISQKSYPNINIRHLTPDMAAAIYKADYWDKIGGDDLPPATAAVVFDTAVNHGVGTAKKLLSYSGGDPEGIIKRRERIYNRLAHDPSQKQFHQGWMNRLANLRDRIGTMLNPIGTANADETPWQAQDVPDLSPEDIAAYDATQASAVPDLTPEDIAAFDAANPQDLTAGQKVGGVITDIGGGVLKGASNIGNTLLSAGDSYNELVGNKNALTSLDSTGEERRKQATEGLKSMGVDTGSGTYQGAGLATEIAGTVGVGGLLAKGAAKVAPGMAEALASGGMKGASLAQKAAGGAVSGAATAGLVDPETALAGGVVGAVLPPGVAAASKAGALAGKVAKSAKKALTPAVSDEVKALASKAEQLGIDIPIDKIANSKPLNALAKSLEYIPGSGREATQEAMHKQVNKAVSKTIGQDTNNINKALRDADSHLGSQFEKTLQENPVKVDDAFIEGLGRVEKEAESILVKDQFAVIKKQIDNILEKGSSGQIDGEAAYNIKKLLDKIGKGSDATKATVAIDLKHELMGALDRSLGTEKAAAFKKVREQYGNMLELEKIARNGAEGDISVARLANMKNVRSKELKDLADIAAQFVTEREGQHGAMQRVFAGGAMGATAGLPGLVAGAAGGRALNMLLNSKALRQAAVGGKAAKKATPGRLEKLAEKLPAGTIQRASILAGTQPQRQ